MPYVCGAPIQLTTYLTPPNQTSPTSLTHSVCPSHKQHWPHLQVFIPPGLQFFDRLLLLFMPTKYQPNYVYLKYVPLSRVHLFTLIQVGYMYVYTSNHWQFLDAQLLHNQYAPLFHLSFQPFVRFPSLSFFVRHNCTIVRICKFVKLYRHQCAFLYQYFLALNIKSCLTHQVLL